MTLFPLDVEHRLLLACALAPEGVDLSSVLAFASRDAFSWERLVDSATANRIRPQLAAQLRGAALHSPAARKARSILDEVLQANEGAGLFMAGDLILVLDALRAAEVPAVPFKGPAFAALVGGGPGLREMGDLDLLIDPANIGTAVRALATLGFDAMLPAHAIASPWLAVATNELPLIRRHDSTLVELHWKLGQYWFPAACEWGDIFPRLTERRFFGRSIPWPATEELLLIHVTDVMKSCGCGIRWVADIAQILRAHADLDWDRLRRVAARNGGLNTLRIALAVVEDLVGDVARLVNVPALALDLSAEPKALAAEARTRENLAQAMRSIRERIGTDAQVVSAIGHFHWALRVADRPIRTAASILRHLLGPAVADLDAMPARDESDLALRLRALRRRLKLLEN